MLIMTMMKEKWREEAQDLRAQLREAQLREAQAQAREAQLLALVQQAQAQAQTQEILLAMLRRLERLEGGADANGEKA